jgi:hypothetical protein
MNAKHIFDIHNDNITDFEIISKLHADGPQYLELCLRRIKYLQKSLSDNSLCDYNYIIDCFNNYHQMYLGNAKLFPNNYFKYISLMITNDGELWNSFKGSFSEIKNHVLNFIQECNQNFRLTQMISLYHILTSDKYLEFLDNAILWNNINVETEHFLGILIKRGSNIIKNAQNIFLIVLKMLKNKNIINKFIIFISNIFNSNIGRDNNILAGKRNANSSYFLNATLILVGKLFLSSYSNHRAKLIDPTYIISNSCHIKWTSLQNNNEVKYNLITKLLYLFLHAIRTCYSPNISIHQKLTDEISHLTILIEQQSRFSNEIQSPQIITLRKKLTGVQNYIKEINYVIYNKYTLKVIEKFYKILAYLFIVHDIRNFYINNDIMADMSLYLLTRSSKIYKLKDNNVIQLITRNIGTTDYISNPYVRTAFVSVVEKYTKINKFDIDNKEFQHMIQENLINIFTSLKEDNDNLSIKLKIIKLFSFLGTQNNKFTLDNLINKNLYKFKKFLSCILISFSNILDTIHQYSDKINQDFVLKDLSIIKNSVIVTEKYILLFDYLSTCCSNSEVLEILLSDELKINFTSIINRVVKELRFSEKYAIIPQNTPHFSQFPELKQILRDGVKTDNIIISLLKVIFNFKKHTKTYLKHDLEYEISQNTIYFDITDFVIIASEPKIIDKLNSDDHAKFLEKILSTCCDDDSNNNSYDEIDIPSEFCDPILCTLIEDPVMLPETYTIISKSTITRQLLRKEEHPLTRNELTMEILNKFNATENIKKQIDEYKIKLNIWKNNKKYN